MKLTSNGMKTVLKKSYWLTISFLLPYIVLAQVGTGPGGGTGGARLDNPLKGVDNLTTLIVKILDIVVQIGGYIAVLAIVWSGFLFVKAQGSPEELKTAKQAFFYTIIGVAILLGAKGLALALGATIKAVTGT